jgi:hypothetical protein
MFELRLHTWILTTITAVVLLLLGLSLHRANAEEQTRFYDSRGNSIGTAAPQGAGSVRYFDSRGNSLGTTTTTPGGTTTFYDSRGSVTGHASGPAPSHFGGARR